MKKKKLKIEPAPGNLKIITDFVNTADLELGTDLWPDPEALATWLAGHGLLPIGTVLTEADLERVVVVREGFHALMCAHNGFRVDVAVIRELDRSVAAASLRVRFDDDGVTSYEPVPAGVDGALARLVRFVEEAQRRGEWPRLKGCANDGCRKAFYDHSSNRSGKWCSKSRCGNRINAKRYRRRYKRQRGKWPSGG